VTVTLSLIIGGESSANRPLIRAVHALKVKAKERWADRESEPDAASLDIVFKVSGPIAAGDFEGVEVGKWISAKQLMVMQVGVPETLPGGDAKRFLEATLPEVVQRARAHLAKKKVDASLDEAEALVADLVASLSEPA
jgi:hypothetical protein